MSVGRAFVVRVAEPADEPALAILERTAPDSGQIALRLCPRLGYLDLASRYPGVTGFVAIDPGYPGLIGMLFSSVAVPGRLIRLQVAAGHDVVAGCNGARRHGGRQQRQRGEHNGDEACSEAARSELEVASPWIA